MVFWLLSSLVELHSILSLLVVLRHIKGAILSPKSVFLAPFGFFVLLHPNFFVILVTNIF